MLLLITKNIMGKERYRRYPEEVKEDLASEMVLKLLKSLHTFNGVKYKKAFGWCALVCDCAAATFFGKYYRHLNLVNDLTEKSLTDGTSFDTIDVQIENDLDADIKD